MVNIITVRNEVAAGQGRCLSVILFTGGGVSASVHAGIHTPTGTPPRQVHPPAGTPHHDGHCSGQYASYWNAFLFSSRYFMICIITACEGCFHRCLSVHGGGVSASGPRGGVPDTPSPGQTPPLLGRHPSIHRQPPLRCPCWDMINKRAVRIPLECILVKTLYAINLL